MESVMDDSNSRYNNSFDVLECLVSCLGLKKLEPRRNRIEWSVDTDASEMPMLNADAFVVLNLASNQINPIVTSFV